MRLEPYETMTVGLIQEGEGNSFDRDATFQEVKDEVERWIRVAEYNIKKASPR